MAAQNPNTMVVCYFADGSAVVADVDKVNAAVPINVTDVCSLIHAKPKP